jgi:3-oxoacyl-[acyl-carrier protein] reductase
MNDQQTAIDAIAELETAWSQAEMGADIGTLEAISTPDFMLVGPLGFVLDKRQWLERYRSGDLVTGSLSLEDSAIRVYGAAAVTTARHIQRASYRGQPVDGQFRTTHITVRVDRRWLLAGIHLSPIGVPPPFARPDEQITREGTTAGRSKRTVSTRVDDRAGGLPRYPDLAGKVAVVTGGSRGIGAATARALAANGVDLAVVGRDKAALSAVVDSIRVTEARAIPVRADCTQEDDVRHVADTVAETLGVVDILAAFAGGNGMPVPTTEETPDHWHAVIDTDLTSTFLTVGAFLPSMVELGRGSIVTMSSAAGRQPARSNAAYAAAKAGVVAFTRHLANEVAPNGVRVNCVAPSSIETERLRSWTTPEVRRQLAESFPLRRIGHPGDVAAATLFLASGASSWITGTTMDIAGGKIMI